MIHEMNLKTPYFNKIKNGQKIYEIRLNDEKRQAIKSGDIIIFRNESALQEELKTKVKDLIYFKSFNEMLEVLPADKIGFLNYNNCQIEEIYHTIYSVENENKFGVVAIKLEKINEN